MKAKTGLGANSLSAGFSMHILKPLQDYYQSKSTNEQLILKALGITILLALWYNFFSAPAQKEHQRYEKRLEKQIELKAWLSNNLPAAKPKRATASHDNRSLLTIVTETSKLSQIALNRVQPGEDGSIRLWIESVNFNSLMAWLHQLQTQHNIQAQEISVQRLETGFTSSSIELARPST
ncbi:MAG: type II secretion system protein GspM [Flavobacteriaceae bacterium]